MATLKEKRHGVGGIQMPRQNVEHDADSNGEFRGIFKELRERLSAIAEAETRPLTAYGNNHLAQR